MSKYFHVGGKRPPLLLKDFIYADPLSTMKSEL
jgi:hypothetical protein